jgi:hypothetical protein
VNRCASHNNQTNVCLRQVETLSVMRYSLWDGRFTMIFLMQWEAKHSCLSFGFFFFLHPRRHWRLFIFVTSCSEELNVAKVSFKHESLVLMVSMYYPDFDS